MGSERSASGACLLHRYRPLSCRTYGLPVRDGAEILPPCRLNFEGYTENEVSAATIEPDSEDLEGRDPGAALRS